MINLARLNKNLKKINIFNVLREIDFRLNFLYTLTSLILTINLLILNLDNI